MAHVLLAELDVHVEELLLEADLHDRRPGELVNLRSVVEHYHAVGIHTDPDWEVLSVLNDPLVCFLEGTGEIQGQAGIVDWLRVPPLASDLEPQLIQRENALKAIGVVVYENYDCPKRCVRYSTYLRIPNKVKPFLG